MRGGCESAPPGRAEKAEIEAPLGRYAKSQAIVDSKGVFPGSRIDPETGEIIRAEGAQDPSATRLERFALQSAARRLLPSSRTSKCLRVPFRPDGGVDVWHSAEHRSASYGGLQTCGSVWACPVCAAKISERRKAEILTAGRSWVQQGGWLALLTLTHSHAPSDRLADLVAGQQKAVTRLFGCRAGKDLMRALSRFGHIRGWEATHGLANGWHPHFHILLFLEHRMHGGYEAYEDWAFSVWRRSCELSGLPLPNRAHGVKLEGLRGSVGAAGVADDQLLEALLTYPSKMGLEETKPECTWGAESELTKGHIKRAKAGSRTPFDLLRSVLDDDRQAGALFQEFARVFKGKRQLVWSRGLRDQFDLDDVTDEELASAHEADAVILGRLNPEDWKRVLRFDVRGELLELARHGSWEPVERLLAGLAVRG